MKLVFLTALKIIIIPDSEANVEDSNLRIRLII